MLYECLSYSELSARQGNASCTGTRAQPTGLPGICCSLGIATCFPLSGLMHSNMCPPSSYPQAGSSSCVPHAPLWHLVSIGPSLTPLCSCSACCHEQWQLHTLVMLPWHLSEECEWVSLPCHFNMYQVEMQVYIGHANVAPVQAEGAVGSLLLSCPLGSQVI